MTIRLSLALSFLLGFSCNVGTPPSSNSSPADSDGGILPTPQPVQTVFWYRDVQPLVQKHCQSCHSPGEATPFSLESYEKAKPFAEAMASAVKRGSMPPWKPARDCQNFRNSRGLTESEKSVFIEWANQLAPEGNVSDAKEYLKQNLGLSHVDAELAPEQAYVPNATKPDDYRCFIVDPRLTTDRDIVGFDVEPGVRQWVHHVILFAGSKQDAIDMDAQEAGPGWTCFGGPGTPNPQMLGGWVPGTYATQFPEGTGVRLAAGRVMVMQVHYNTSHAHSDGHSGHGAPQGDLTRVRVQYAPTPIPQNRRAIILPALNTRFRIPPNSTDVTATANLPATNALLWGVIPHMHTRGKKIKVQRDNECLIDIPQWDFNWQQTYFYENPIELSLGQTLNLTCTWDNPSNQEIGWGEGTDDEMCLNFFYFTGR